LNYTYDANGNMLLRDEFDSSYLQEWTPDNKINSILDGRTGYATRYLYDAAGMRVWRNAPDGKTLYVTDDFEKVYDRVVVTPPPTGTGNTFSVNGRLFCPYVDFDPVLGDRVLFDLDLRSPMTVTFRGLVTVSVPVIAGTYLVAGLPAGSYAITVKTTGEQTCKYDLNVGYTVQVVDQNLSRDLRSPAPTGGTVVFPPTSTPPPPNTGSTKWAEAAGAAVPPVIDGSLDTVWLSATPYSITNILFGTPPSSLADMAATFRAMWDFSALYLLLEVQDDSLFSDPPTFRYDSVTVYLPYGGPVGYKTASCSSSGYTAEIQCVMRRFGQQTVYELRIPWSFAEITPISNGLTPIEVSALDNDADGSSVSLRWNSVGGLPLPQMGNLRLLPAPATPTPTPSPSRTPLPTPTRTAMPTPTRGPTRTPQPNVGPQPSTTPELFTLPTAGPTPVLVRHRAYLPVVLRGISANSLHAHISAPQTSLACNASQSYTRKYYRFNGQRIAMRTVYRDGCSELVYLYGDHLGSNSLAIDSSGTKLWDAAYTPFGTLRPGTTGNTAPTDRLFTNQRQENTSFVGNVYDYNARLYLPTLGRFMSADSIVPSPSKPQSLNRYSYVGNTPLMAADPSGHCTWFDEECNNTYSDVAGQLGFDPLPMKSSWSTSDLRKLQSWLNRGVRFSHLKYSDGSLAGEWSAANLWEAVVALEITEQLIGSRTDELLGLANGGMLTLYAADYVHYPMQDSFIMSVGGQFIAGQQTIYLWQGGMSRYPIAHELGHAVDDNLLSPDAHIAYCDTAPCSLGPLNGTYHGHTGWDARWDWSQSSIEWALAHTNPQGGFVSSFAKTNRMEDFAVTFTWMAFEPNGIPFYYGLMSSPSDDRRTLMTNALKGYP
jgi:RHS repeat-associated protein